MPIQTRPAEQFTLMWDSDLREQAARLAVLDDRSVSAVIRTALREHLARRLPAAPTPAEMISRPTPFGGNGADVIYSNGSGDAA